MLRPSDVKDLLTFLTAVAVPDEKSSRATCSLSTVQIPVGPFVAIGGSRIRGPQLTLGPILPCLMAENITLPRLLQMGREELNAFAHKYRLTPSQWMTLASNIRRYSDCAACDDPLAVVYEDADGGRAIAVKQGGNQDCDAHGRLCAVPSPDGAIPPDAEIVCRRCNAIRYGAVLGLNSSRTDSKRVAPPSHEAASMPMRSDYSLLGAAAINLATEDDANSKRMQHSIVTSTTENMMWSFDSPLVVAAIRSRFSIPPGDAITQKMIVKMLRATEANAEQVSQVSMWWVACLKLTGGRSKYFKASFQGPTTEQMCALIAPHAQRAVLRVFRKYSPESSHYAVKAEAHTQLSPTTPQQDAAFLQLFSMCSNPTVVSTDDVIRCWKVNPSLMVPFLPHFVMSAVQQGPTTFVPDVKRSNSVKR